MSNMIYLALVLFELGFIIGLFYYTRIKFKEIEDNLDVLINSINKISKKTFEVGEDFENHCHKYEFSDNVLYIQEPIITKKNS